MNEILRQRLRPWFRMLEDHNCLICRDPVEDGLIRQFLLRGERSRRRVPGLPRDTGEELCDYLCSRCASSLPFSFGGWTRLSRSGIPYISVLRYEGGVREAVLRLKFGGETVLADFFALLAEIRLRRLHFRPALILPVPLGKARERKRGYNQAALIAKALAGRMGTAADGTMLLRTEETCPQTEMASRAGRQVNVEGAFSLSGRPSFALPEGAEILLLDDVCTSGATLREAARPLLKAGLRVRALSVAREAEKEFSHPGGIRHSQMRANTL